MSYTQESTRYRLPTLFEVLNLRTKAPVDLWGFYVFMREEYRGIEYLDFWLAVVKHLSLCRNYVRGLRQSIVASERDISSSRTSSVLLDTLIQDGTLDDSDSHRLSAFLRGEDPGGRQGNGYRLSELLDTLNPKDEYLALEIQQLRNRPEQDAALQLTPPNTSVIGAQGKQKSSGSPIRVGMSDQAPQGAIVTNLLDEEKQSTSGSPYDTSSIQSGSAAVVTTRASPAHTNAPQLATTSAIPQPTYRPKNSTADIKRAMDRSSQILNGSTRNGDQPSKKSAPVTSFVSRNDIRQSTHYILVTYFIPGAEREIVIPQRIMGAVRNAIEVDGRDDPEVFDEAREYVFEAMQREAFPAFLAARALGNTTPFGSIVRLSLGLVAMFAAFWLGFTQILLNWESRHRIWLVLPFALGVYGVCAGVYHLDPVLAALGYSESIPWKLIRVKEIYVRKILVKRALYVFLVMVVVAASFVVLFVFVPGHRLGL